MWNWLSNHRSKSPAQTKATHKWKIEVDEISAGVDCTGHLLNNGGSYEQDTKTRFQWKLELNEDEKKRLFEGQEISEEGSVEFIRADDKRKLWPFLVGKGNEGLKVEINEHGGALKVDLGRWAKGERGGWVMNSTFTCTWTGLKGQSKGRVIYQATLDRMDGELWQYIRPSTPLKLRISLGECRPSSDEQKAECNLKVTTSKN
ncbi:hypothetical protein DNK47_03285 [Mycoplasma wenyonii]|uniref:Uncharacterized protein n=1 Tax=Mycoplasma wenyonii TaxID=65123 RepID=A0A328PJV7_9MOLU|nr:hypothetical protein [Mycoplasma wenyonii]RAO94764.1 hypothetical protein DNK47_03285 [Mycoplasma wenyonii]